MARAGPEKAVRTSWDCVRPSYGDFINSAREMQLYCYINPDFSVKMSDLSEHSEFDYRSVGTP